ncbi:MAG: LamG domain-containing protein [Candidatus Poribacteria bacterium]|nr:LamG domain-containing protein [Candidatus Poribacteria bacterium]
MVCASAFAIQLDDDVMLYLPFEEGSGKVTADMSGNGNDGMLMGGLQWVDGRMGGALEFNATDTYVEVASNPTLQALGDGWTLAVWIKLTAETQAWGRIVDKFYGTGYCIGRQNVNPVMNMEWCGSANNSTTTTEVFDDNWHHVVATRDAAGGSNVLRLYVDGVKENEFGGGCLVQQNQDTTPVRIGAGDTCCDEGGAVGYFVDGIIDEVVIYRRALTGGEITALMNEGIDLAVQPQGKLTTTWASIRVDR